MFKGAIGIAALMVFVSLANANAAQLVYTPTNPTFGGNPNNAPGLLATATANNKFTNPANTTPVVTPTQAIANQITQSVLANIASKITTDINNGNSSGSYNIGGSNISFTTQGQNIILTVNDGSGGLTTITIPSPNNA